MSYTLRLYKEDDQHQLGVLAISDAEAQLLLDDSGVVDDWLVDLLEQDGVEVDDEEDE